ncbi:RWD domain-containing protein 3 [Araneus ventricosus]|uniref:RWD domain-containing protein 3 n=1 Tax=Araneus ventricosus TaxID=182803 RepID=A0A4Y2QPL9_ARAVE|nr:RWD domain-containing protein 3 [Araneus ventricosus]GBN65290.1 RWD domain-containing protein 3 [Araneus ventricosus]
MEVSFLDELECLKASYDAHEFTHYISSQCHILKFNLPEDNCLTFEIPNQYPQVIPQISLASTKLSKAKRILVEKEIRDNAEELVGSPMIMDLVIKSQEIFENHFIKHELSQEKVLEHEDNHTAVILIDHIRQRNRYLKALRTWASELNVVGVLMFCHKWIFLIIQGSKKKVKEYIIHHRTTCIDVDSSGKPCKEKMSKILFEGDSLKCFTSFLVEELSTLKDLEEYLKYINLESIYQEVLKPIVFKS